ncbi:MAG TPA: FAD-dependent oxidoreductase, partial [Blastocatellia bacterium]|nr:FAD-dependent oxidoreductase [Blastocatellia bacterium]
MEADAVIIGAGVLGSSVALGLTERSFGRVVVIDADLGGKLASSTLNVGGVRATWWWPINIELSLRSLEYFWTIRDEIAYRRLGYLWMYDEERWPRACEAISRQNDYGLGVQRLTPDEVMGRVREMDSIAGIAGATFSPLDGLVDSVQIKQHYQRRARAMGAEFLDRWFVTSISRDVDGWVIKGRRIERSSQIDEYLIAEPADGKETLSIKSRVLINAAGPWAARIA